MNSTLLYRRGSLDEHMFVSNTPMFVRVYLERKDGVRAATALAALPHCRDVLVPPTREGIFLIY